MTWAPYNKDSSLLEHRTDSGLKIYSVREIPSSNGQEEFLVDRIAFALNQLEAREKKENVADIVIGYLVTQDESHKQFFSYEYFPVGQVIALFGLPRAGGRRVDLGNWFISTNKDFELNATWEFVDQAEGYYLYRTKERA